MLSRNEFSFNQPKRNLNVIRELININTGESFNQPKRNLNLWVVRAMAKLPERFNQPKRNLNVEYEEEKTERHVF